MLQGRVLDISGGEVPAFDLGVLEERARAAVKQIRDGHVEARLPIIFEFSGSPKSGKSSVIGLIALFLKRVGFRVSTPPEGASIETPPDMKEDLLAFNTWCGCYAVQNILVRCHEGDPYDVLILDRGLFDLVVWLQYLNAKDGSLSTELCKTLQSFAIASPWKDRESAVFLFTADPETSLQRERRSQLTSRPGRAMNPEFLGEVLECYRSAAEQNAGGLPVFRIDTSAIAGQFPDFQRIAYVVCNAILEVIENAIDQRLLVVRPLTRAGVIDDPQMLSEVLAQVFDAPRFLARAEAEQSHRVQQVVPYGVIRNSDGQYLCARRKTNGERPQLAGKLALLFGGHAEHKDWESGPAHEVLERCLRREIGEELMGLTVQDAKFIALVNDRSNEMGRRHLAFVHEVQVSGRAAVRRQTADREFSGSTEWRSRDQIIRDLVKFDPWSQLVAAKLFGVAAPPDAQASLFDNQ